MVSESMPKATPDLVLRLKAEAKLLRQSEGIKLAEAQSRLAQREGFFNWMEMVSAAGGAESVRDAKLQSEHDKRHAERLAKYGRSP